MNERDKAKCESASAYQARRIGGANQAQQSLSGAGMAAECARLTGKAMLMEKVWRIRRQADQLEALARAIPDNFPNDADAGLWEIVSRIQSA